MLLNTAPKSPFSVSSVAPVAPVLVIIESYAASIFCPDASAAAPMPMKAAPAVAASPAAADPRLPNTPRVFFSAFSISAE